MLFRRGKIWFARVKDQNGKWVKRTCNTADRKVAEIRHREIERTEADPAYRAANCETLAAAVDSFKASRVRKGVADGTHAMYKTKCGHVERVLGSDTPLARIDSDAVLRYLDARLEEKASRNTIGKELTAIRGILRTAKLAGKFSGDLDAVIPEWSIDYTPRSRALTRAELETLIDALARKRPKPQGGGVVRNARNQAAAVAFAVLSGTRLGETHRAEAKDIDTAAGLIFVRSTKTKKKGRGDRFVPVVPKTKWLLAYVLKATKGRTGSLFDRWSNVQRDIADACEVAGIPRCSPNDLRRTFANWLVDAGVDNGLVAAVLGHTDSRMVEKVYGRLRPEQLKRRVLEATGRV